MNISLLELRRRPGHYAIATATLTLIAILLIFLGGLLDGLNQSFVGGVSAQDADIIVYSSRADGLFSRSRMTFADRLVVREIPGVKQVGGIGVTLLGARLPGRGPRELVDVAVFGYEIAPRGVPAAPPTGEAYADTSLQRRGVTTGMTLHIGPGRSAVKVIGFVSGTNYLGQGSLWASPRTWRAVQNSNRPDEFVADDVFQAFVVRGHQAGVKIAHRAHADVLAPGSQLTFAIDRATFGRTASFTVADAAEKLPGVAEQSGVFNQIIGVTLAIALVVVALFFALLTIERTALYGVLKATGSRSRTLFGGLVLQALIVTFVAALLGGATAFALDALIPPGTIPFTLTRARLLNSVASLVAAAVVGCAFSLRRVLRVDPATAIGTER